MDIRDATTEDVAEIRRVAAESLSASYGHAIREDAIDAAIDKWYSAQRVTASLNDDSEVFVLAADEGGVVGFAQSEISEGRETVGYLDWLHVVPEHRGAGIGSQLLARLEQELIEADVDRLEGRVLTENEEGVTFYDDQGFSEVGERTVEIRDETFTERVYTTFLDDDQGDPTGLDERRTEDGTSVHIAYDESVRGSDAPFFAVYLDGDRSERYGWMCGADDSLDIAMDTMERLECNGCGNRRKPVRWDAAYL
ncbi:GNAT family N-acetyltransferase [Halobellus clavatus]|jgi:ribosomal protein S18 acetylase RimI-like enzyme|uniref:Ribosomal protein S18 acetylase RimI n=1 Tax=Halobellus clavatus TaxID=660517 RepID=A0A1H3FBY3_9EURY|nr:GNAT family N-acetyltransferase [Halobellus clavatus]SDX87878.1 Ribosomal protein S18 acetylase RimI [Halobellus clavatus]